MARLFQAFDQSGNNYVNKIWQYIVNCQPNCHEFGLVDVPKRK